MQTRFFEMTSADGFSLNRSFDGNTKQRDDKFNKLCADAVRGEEFLRPDDYYSLRIYIMGAHIPGLEFLTEMPENDCYDWLTRSIRQLRKLWRDNPDSFDCSTIKACFDYVRAYRKEKKLNAKKA